MTKVNKESAEDNKVAASQTNEAAGIVKEYYDEKSAESAERRSKGGEDVTISLTNKTLVEFTSDFGKWLKKGDRMEISDQALEIYTKKGKIKKL